MRTSNGIERPIQQELRRRTARVRVFPNLDALERFSTAVLVEIDENAKPKPGHIKWEQSDDGGLHDSFLICPGSSPTG